MTRRRSRAATIILIVLLAALPVIGAFQYRWLDQARLGEETRLRRDVEAAARQIRSELALELASLAAMVVPNVVYSADAYGDPSGGFVQTTIEGFARYYSAWTERARFPELVDEIILVDRTVTETALYRYDGEAGAFERLVHLPPGWVNQRTGGELSWRRTDLAPEEGAFMVVPLPRMVEPVRDEQRSIRLTVHDPGSLYFGLDLDVLARLVLPALLGENLDLSDDGFEAAVVDSSARRVLYSTTPIAYAALERADFVLDHLIALSNRLPGTNTLSFGTRPDGADLLGAAGLGLQIQQPIVQQWLDLRGSRSAAEFQPDGGPRPGLPGDGLSLAIWHTAGGIERAARSERNRNLLLSYAVLALFGGVVAGFYILFRRAMLLREREHEFVSTITHELRTPIAAMHAVADNLADGVVSESDRVREYGRALLEEGRRLRTMIDQVLLYAGLRGSPRSTSAVDLDMEDLVGRAVTRVPGLRRDRLTTRVEPRLPRFRGDPIAVDSILTNLLSNAVKHNEPATAIGLAVRAETRGLGYYLVVQVTDNGRGIPRRELSRVREAFFRGEASQSRQVPGTGLGLNLVDRIVTTYRGKLDIRSTEGRGTVVTVRLPFECADAAET